VASIIPDVFGSAIEFALAHPFPAAFGVAWTLFCAAMLYAAIANDGRPTLNDRLAAEAEVAREVTR
jgi:hypothetical protein